MSKLKKHGATTAISKHKKDIEKSKKGITTVKKKITTSYKVTPLSLRVSLSDKQAIQNWVEDLQDISERNVSAAKLFRALALYRANINDKALIELINKMN